MEDRLRKFAVLVDTGNFTKAAQRLHTSQPALSIAINKLEQELHVKLIVRGIRPFTLTKPGQVVYETAKSLAVTTDNLRTKLAELAHKQLSVAVGMIDSIASMMFLAKDNIFDIEPESNISLVVNNSRYLLRAVENDELDTAFVTEQINSVGRHIQLQFVAVEPLVLVVHSAQAATAQAAWRSGQLKNFISYDQPSNSYHLIKRSLDQSGVSVTPVFFSTSVDVMLSLVQLQKGIAVLPYTLVKDYVASKELSMIGKPHTTIIDRRIFTIMRRDKQSNYLLNSVSGRIAEQLNYYYRELTTKK